MMLKEELPALLTALLLTIPISYVFYKLHLPIMVGFILTGILIGPSFLSLIKDIHLLESLAELGIVFLMFLLGLEFSIKKFISYKKEVFIAGLFQVVLTILFTGFLSFFIMKVDPRQGLFYGALLAFSSTAIVLKILLERGELNTPYGRYIFGILIFQDLSVILVMLALPLFVSSEFSLKGIGITFLKSISIFFLIFIIGLKVIPFFFSQIAKTRVRELFLTSIFVISLGLAFLSYELGLSMALGAFVAGMIISESELVYQTMAEIKPFKDFLLAFFFIVVGALLNINTLFQHLFLIITLFSLAFLIKIFVILFVIVLLSRNLRNALLSALYLFQIGEFSFVLAIEGKKLALMPDNFYQLFISISILSLILTPFIISLAYRLSDFLLMKLHPKKFSLIMKRRKLEEKQERANTIVVGFGLCGRNVSLGLKILKIPYIILELNLATVKHYRKKGEPIFFADATHPEILKKFGVEKAKVLVVAIGDSFAARKIIKIAKTMNPSLYIITRSQFVAEIEELIRLGADEVISEEFEASLELFVKVLEYYKVPKNEIFHLVEQLRSEHYEALRKEDISQLARAHPQEWWKLFKVQTYIIKEKSPLIGLTLSKLNLRAKTGATIISIQRGEDLLPNPSPDTSLQEGDLLLLIGEERAINSAIRYLNEPFEALY